MSRFASLAVAILLCIPSLGQEIFHATPLDETQNLRLDKLEEQVDGLVDKVLSRLDALEEKQATIQPVPDPEPNKPMAAKSYGSTGKAVAAMAVQPAYGSVAPTKSYGSSGSAVAQVQQATGPQWKSTAQLQADIAANWTNHVYAVMGRGSVYAHLTGEHGYSPQQVNGLSVRDADMLHNLAHGPKISPYTTGTAAAVMQPYAGQVMQSRIIDGPFRHVEQVQSQPLMQQQSGCPDGQCPHTQGARRSVQRSGLFRFWR